MMERLIRSPDVIIGDIKIGEKDEWNAYNG